MYGLQGFFRKLYWLYGFFRKLYGFFKNVRICSKKCTDCTDFFFENCTDFLWKCTDFCTDFSKKFWPPWRLSYYVLGYPPQGPHQPNMPQYHMMMIPSGAGLPQFHQGPGNPGMGGNQLVGQPNMPQHFQYIQQGNNYFLACFLILLIPPPTPNLKHDLRGGSFFPFLILLPKTSIIFPYLIEEMSNFRKCTPLYCYYYNIDFIYFRQLNT